MSTGSNDVYEVIFEVRNSPLMAGIEESLAGAKRLDAQWQSTINSMRQRTAALKDSAGQDIPKTQGMFANLGLSAGDAGRQITRMAASFLVFQAGRELVSGMRDALVDLRDYTVTINKELTGMQSNIAELQSITGRAGESNAHVIQEHLELMKYSGMTSQQAIKFASAFTGEAEISREKFDPRQFAMIQQNAARFAMIHGGDAGTHAMLAGRLAGLYQPVEGKEDQQARDIATKQADLYSRLNMAPGETEPLTAVFAAELGKLVSPTGKGGMVGSPEALANMFVAAAKTARDPGEVGTRIEQFSRAMTGLNRSKDWAKFLRGAPGEGGLGVGPNARAEEAMVPLFKVLEQVQARGESIPGFLKSKGLANSQEILAISGMFEGRELYETVRKKKPLSAEEAQEVLTKPYTLGGGRLDLLQSQNEAKKTAVRIEQAQRGQLAEVFRGRAEAELLQQRQIGPEWEAGLGPAERAAYKAQETIHGTGTVVRQKIDALALKMAEREYGMMPKAEAEFNRYESSAVGKAKYMIPGYSAIHEDKYAGFGYTQSNRLAEDVNEMAEAKALGIDAATGKALAGRKIEKHLEDISHGVRKDRPMTVARPAPKVKE